MMSYKTWIKSRKDIKYKHAIDDDSMYETFYITGEDLEIAFKAGARLQRRAVARQERSDDEKEGNDTAYQG